MPTLNNQVQEITKGFRDLHLKALSRSGKEDLAELLSLAHQGKLLSNPVFESSGHAAYYLQIQKLELMLRGAGDEKERAIGGLIANLKAHQANDPFDFSPYSDVDNVGDVAEMPMLSEVMGEYAKDQDIYRRLKACIYADFNKASYENLIADDLPYVLEKAKANGVSPEQLQRVFKEVNFSPSLTAHPTNPESEEYVRVAMDLVDAIFDAGELRSRKVDAVALVDQLVATPITDLKKKTQAKEVEEALCYLNAIYNSVDGQYAILQDALRSSEDYNGVQLPDDMNNICVWVSGDGDGNSAATTEALANNIVGFRKAIKAHYGMDMDMLPLSRKFDFARSKSPEELIGFLQEEKKKTGPESYAQYDSLIRKVKTFGYHFAQIDIRHTAVDLLAIDQEVTRLMGNYDLREEIVGGLAAIGEDATDRSIRKVVVNKIIREDGFLGAHPPAGEDKRDLKMIRRLLGRFELAAHHPDMFKKVIAAEFNHPSQIESVMNILRDTGHRVGREADTNSLIIVPLAESKANLEKLHDDISVALLDDEYYEHVKRTKEVTFMIARSDTVRRNGVGAQYSQEKAIVNSVRTIMERLIKDPDLAAEDLAEFKVVSYSGGGAALQRGGGKMTELASVYGRYAIAAIATLREQYEDHPELLKKLSAIQVKEPYLTTQGHQNALLYQHGAGTMSSFISQAVYSGLKKRDHIKDSQVDLTTLERLGVSDEAEIVGLEAQSKVFLDAISEKACEVYSRDIGSEDSKDLSPADKLLASGPWQSTGRGKKASRPAKRGVADAGDAGGISSIGSFVGKNPRILNQRAIGSESISSHFGANLIAWLGWREAVGSVVAARFPEGQAAGGEFLQKMFATSKSFRDLLRSADMSVDACNFDKSWKMLGADEQPTQAEIDDYHAKYHDLARQEGGLAEVESHITLGYLQKESQLTSELFKAIAGHELSPHSHVEHELSKAECAAGIKLETALTRLANLHPESLMTDQYCALVDNTYTATDCIDKAAKLMEPQRQRRKGVDFNKPLPTAARFTGFAKYCNAQADTRGAVTTSHGGAAAELVEVSPATLDAQKFLEAMPGALAEEGGWLAGRKAPSSTKTHPDVRTASYRAAIGEKGGIVTQPPKVEVADGERPNAEPRSPQASATQSNERDSKVFGCC